MRHIRRLKYLNGPIVDVLLEPVNVDDIFGRVVDGTVTVVAANQGFLQVRLSRYRYSPRFQDHGVLVRAGFVVAVVFGMDVVAHRYFIVTTMWYPLGKPRRVEGTRGVLRCVGNDYLNDLDNN